MKCDVGQAGRAGEANFNAFAAKRRSGVTDVEVGREVLARNRREFGVRSAGRISGHQNAFLREIEVGKSGKQVVFQLGRRGHNPRELAAAYHLPKPGFAHRNQGVMQLNKGAKTCMGRRQRKAGVASINNGVARLFAQKSPKAEQFDICPNKPHREAPEGVGLARKRHSVILEVFGWWSVGQSF